MDRGDALRHTEELEKQGKAAVSPRELPEQETPTDFARLATPIAETPEIAKPNEGSPAPDRERPDVSKHSSAFDTERADQDRERKDPAGPELDPERPVIAETKQQLGTEGLGAPTSEAEERTPRDVKSDTGRDVNIAGEKVEHHHHAGVRDPSDVWLSPKVAGEQERIDAVHPRRGDGFDGTLGDNADAFKDMRHTDHDPAVKIDKADQAQASNAAGAKADNPKLPPGPKGEVGFVDASATSTGRSPTGADQAGRPTENPEPSDASPVAVESPLNRPADQVVDGVTYHPVWDATNEVWDLVDDAERSLYSSIVSGDSGPAADASTAGDEDGSLVVQFWSAVEAVRVTERAKALSDEAVARLLREQGPKLAELQKEIDFLKKRGWQENLHGQTRRLTALEAAKAERDAVLDAYDPAQPRSSQLPTGVFVDLPYSTKIVPLQGPHELSPLLLDPRQEAKYAPDLVPDRGVRFGKYGGLTWTHDAVRSSVGDAYAYNIQTDAFQVANDLDRLARAGYTEIHIATGTHGTRVGGLVSEVRFLREDARSILETMQRNPGLKIIPYNMSDPVQAANFDAAQARAADGKLPGGATVAAFCFSRTRVLDPNPDGPGAYASTEVLDGKDSSAAKYLHGGLSVGFGALSVYDGLRDPNSAVSALKIGGGTAQIIGGTTSAIGHAKDAVGAVRFGSRLATAGGWITGPLALVDIYRDMRQKFGPGARPMEAGDALFASVDTTLKLAGVLYWPAAVAAIAVNYGAKPTIEAVSEYATPMFIGAISEAYGVPSQYLWGMK